MFRFAIWIGPQMAEYCGSCSMIWPYCPNAECISTSQMNFRDIYFTDIQIIDPKQSPGVIVGNDTNPIYNVVFDNVIVNYSNITNPDPFGNAYYCDGADEETIFTNDSSPELSCPDTYILDTTHLIGEDFFADNIIGSKLTELLSTIR